MKSQANTLIKRMGFGSRSGWLSGLLGAGLVLSASAASAEPLTTPLKVAFVYVGPVGDAGWSYAHDQGRLALEKELGAAVKTTYVESVPEGADAERVIRQLAVDGNQLIFTTSFGYMEATVKVARMFPKVAFEHATGFKQAKNLGIYETRFYEGAYLLGVLAGGTTKSNTLGFVGSFPIPEVIRNIDAFTLGAQSVNPKIKTKVIWVNTWYDPGKERQAAETLIAQGADVMCQNTDSPATLQVAQEKGVYACGWDSDMGKFAPKAQLSANINNWGPYYIKVARSVIAGTWKPAETKLGIADGVIKLAPVAAAVPAATVKAFEETKAAIAAGSFYPFQGPIKDQAGTVKVAAGAMLTQAEMMSINWYVAGVEGSIPK
ncbi:MAG: family transporter substrate-binding protein [Hydrocarboniphaga sp.]|uniref:BMP family ABC transporter substrate-binding protein n=1 Tax=Hydrocarboniphaga sp. TaxID=2033016 RepID=UPI0026281EA4|nr:BMP family ABC transporter substrate-binding protein [Hydrocarboniphaga sp.]MDB5971561.1 family transporter substrate-binding protein [Hydrocarboniphaga sp.]